VLLRIILNRKKQKEITITIPETDWKIDNDLFTVKNENVNAAVVGSKIDGVDLTIRYSTIPSLSQSVVIIGKKKSSNKEEAVSM